MTISSTTNRVSANGNGATTAFPFNYPFRAQADLVVISTVIATGVQTVKALTTDYTISGTPDALGYYSNGGTVNFLVAPASTVRITIYRDPARTQSLDLINDDSLPAESLEAQLDYVTMLIQRAVDVVTRSLRQPEGDSADIGRLPSAVDRASMYLGFDASSNPIALAAPANTTAVSAFMATVLDDTTAALARATLAAAGSGLATASGLTMNTAKLLGRTTASAGAVEEIAVGTDLTLAAAVLSVTQATTSLAGKIEIATQAEVDAMTDTVRAITPNHQKIASGTSVAATSGTSIDFASIPAGVNRIHVQLNGVSLSGTADLLVQLGAGSVTSSGYVAQSVRLNTSSGTGGASSTAGLNINASSASAAVTGHMILTRQTGDTWVASHAARLESGLSVVGGGAVTLSGTLDRVRLTTTNGSDTFDAGSVNIQYER